MSQRVYGGLTVADYSVFGVTLAVSAAIGIFFAVKSRKSRDGLEGYMLGGRSLRMILVAFSLSVTYLSAITILGVPSEIYYFGTMYQWYVLSSLITSAITCEIYLPVFYRLRISTTFEYLERRFNRPVRILSTICYMLIALSFLGIVIYAPALALNAITGFSLWGSILSTGLVCIFYTTLGGLKAVVWTDVFQAIVIWMGFLAIVIEGSSQLGGYAEVWRICYENGRIDFLHFETDSRIRHTFWSIVVGGCFLNVYTIGLGQGQVQRYLSCKTEAQAKGAVFLYWLGTTINSTLCVIIGTILYAYFHGCDPLANGEVEAADQLLPYLTLQLLAKYPGLPGLVVSCVFSGSLSTVSTSINSLSLVTIVDFIKPHTNLTESKYTWISKGLVITYGAFAIGMAYLMSQLRGSVLQIALSLGGIFGGPTGGLFSMGILFPFANFKGAFIGYVAGLASTTWLYIGSRIYPAGQEFTRRLSVSTELCYVDVNFTALADTTAILPSQPTTVVNPSIADFYHLSYVYYSCIGFGVTVVFGLIVSLMTDGWRQRKQVDLALLHFFFDHWIFKWLPKKFRDLMRCGIATDRLKSNKTRKEQDSQNSVFLTNFKTSGSESSENTNAKECEKMEDENNYCSDSKQNGTDFQFKNKSLTVF